MRHEMIAMIEGYSAYSGDFAWYGNRRVQLVSQFNQNLVVFKDGHVSGTVPISALTWEQKEHQNG